MANAGNAGSKTSSIMQKLGKIGSVAMKGIITAVTAAGTALLALGKKAVNVGMNFETSMSQVMATMGVNTATAEGQAAYDKLSAAAEKMGAETAFTASQAADALNYLALAGYDADKAVAALPTVLHLAGAGGMDLATASDMITDSMAALQMEVNQTNLDKFADQMAKTASTTNTSVSQLGEAILTVGATAANLRNGTTELNTQLGILANVGIKGAEGGTHLRNILLRLQSPTDKAAKQLKKLGVSVYDTDGKMRDTGAIFEDLKNSMAGMDQNEIDQIMSTIFNKTDIAAANALLAASGDEYNRIFSIIENSGGAAAEMYQTMLDNLKGDVDIFNSATEALYLSLYKSVNGTMRNLVQTGTSYMNRLNDAFNAGGFEGLVNELGNVLGDAVSVIMGYVPKLVEAGTGIVIAFVESIGNNADTVAQAAVDVAMALGSAIIKIAPKLAAAFVKMIGAAGKALIGAIPDVFRAVPDSVYNALGLDKSKVMSNVQRFARNMKAAISKLFKGDIFGSVDSIGRAFNIDEGALTKIKSVLTTIGNAFSKIWAFAQKAGAAIAGFIGKFANIGGIEAIIAGVAAGFVALKAINIGKSIMGFVSGIKAAGTALSALMASNPAGWIVAAIAAVVAAIVLLVKNWDKVKAALQKGLDAVFGKGTFDKIAQKISGIGEAFKKVGAWAGDAFGKMKSAFGEGMKNGGIFGGISAAFGSLKQSIAQLDFSGVAAKVDKIFGAGTFNKFSKAATKAVNKVGKAFKKFGNWAQTSFDTIKSSFIDGFKSGGFIGGVKAAFNSIKTILKNVNWKGIWDGIKSTASDLLSIGKTVATGAFNKIKSLFQSVNWSGIWDKIKNTASELWDKVKSAASSAVDSVKTWFGSVDWAAIWSKVSNTASSLWEKLKAAASVAFAFIKAWFLSVDWKGIWTTVTQTATALWEKLKGAASTAIALVKAWFQTIDWKGIWNTISTTAITLWNKMKSAAVTAVALVKAWFMGIDWSAIWTTITTTAIALWNKLKGAASAAIALVKAWFMSIDWSSIWTTISTTAIALWNKLKSAASTAVALVKAWFLSIDWSAIWTTITTTAASLWGKLKTAASLAIAAVKAWFQSIDWSAIWNGITRTLSSLWGKLKTVASLAATLLKSFFTTKFSGIGEKFGEWFGGIQTALEPLQPVFESIASAFESSFGSLKDSIEPIKTAFEDIKTKLSELWTKLTQGGDNGAPSSLQVIGNALLNIGKVILGVFGAVGTVVIGVVNGIINALGPLIQAFASVFGAVIDVITAVVQVITGDFSGAWESIKSAFSGIWEAIKSIGQAIGNFFSGIWSVVSGVISAISGAFSGIGAFISGIWADVVNGLISALNWCIDRINNLTGGLSSIWTWTGLEGIGEIQHIDPIEVPVKYTTEGDAPTTDAGAGVDIPIGADTSEYDQAMASLESEAAGATVPAPGMDMSTWDGQVSDLVNNLTGSFDDVSFDFPEPDTSGLDAANTQAQELATTANSAVDALSSIELPDLSGSTAELDNISAAVAAAQSDIAGLETTLSSLDLSTAGGEAGAGYMEGLANTDASSAASALTTNAENAVRAAQQSGSPAAAYMPIGAEAAQGYGMGLQQEDVASYAEAFASAAMAAVTAATQTEAAALTLEAEGTNTISTYAAGMTSGSPVALAVMKVLGVAIRAAAQAVNLTAQGANMLRTLTNGMNSGRSAAIASARTTGSGIRSAFSSVNLYSVGSNIVAGLRNGMNAMFSSLLATARSMAAQLKSTIQSGMQVHSPSRFTDWIGRMTGLGLINSLEKITPKVTAAAAAMAVGVTSAFAPVAVAAPSFDIPQATVADYPTPAAPQSIGVSPYQTTGQAASSDDFSSSTNERHIVIDLKGGGKIEVSGLTKDQAIELIYEQLKPQLSAILAEEIFEGGKNVYEF